MKYTPSKHIWERWYARFNSLPQDKFAATRTTHRCWQVPHPCHDLIVFQAKQAHTHDNFLFVWQSAAGHALRVPGEYSYGTLARLAKAHAQVLGGEA